MSKVNKKLCIYCDTRVGSTKDHVPPKSLFPRPRPTMVTVPCCEICQNEYKKDEDLFAAYIMFGPAGATKKGKQHWEKTIHRRYEKDIGLRHAVAKCMRYVDFETQEGIFLRSGFVIDPDVQRITNVITKILRGLYWIEFNEMLAANKEIKFIQGDAKDRLVADAMRLYEKSKIKRKSEAYDEDIFRYYMAQPDDEDNETCWIMVFYDVTVFVGYIS